MGDVSQIDAVIAALERGERWTAYLVYHRQSGEPLECCFKAVRNLARETSRPFPARFRTHRDDPEYERLRRQLQEPTPGVGRTAGLLALALAPAVVGLLVIVGALPVEAGAVSRWLLGSTLLLIGLLTSALVRRRLRERRLLLGAT